jgi:hypothetical protein
MSPSVFVRRSAGIVWRQKALLQRCKQPMGTEATVVMQQSADKVRPLMVQTHLFRGHAMARADTTKRSKTRCQRSQRKLSAHSALHPRDCLIASVPGTLGYFHPVYLH